MDHQLNVYIWDMDETLILLKSLLNGTYAEPFNGSKNVKNGVEIGKMWENQILQICDDHFFYDQIENVNQPYVDAMSEFDDGRDLSDYNFNQDGFGPALNDVNKRKLAYRHRVIAQRYREGLNCLLDQEMIDFWNKLYDATDSYTDQWLSSARACLEQCAAGDNDMPPYRGSHDATFSGNTAPQHVNVLVTSGSLIPSLIKCLLFRLDNVISCENVYSSWDVGKLQCFSWIKDRFKGPNVQFCVIGDGWEECEAAETMRWPFVKIDPQPSSYHRFPGLTLKDLGHYFSIIYGHADEENEQ